MKLKMNPWRYRLAAALIPMLLGCGGGDNSDGRLPEGYARDNGSIEQCEPYLIYEGSPTAMTVLRKGAPETLYWGTPGEPLTNWIESETLIGGVQRWTIQGLMPGQRYAYRVAASDDYTFRTAPDPSSASVRFFAYGDTQNADVHDRIAQRIIETCTEDPSAQSLILHVGDHLNFSYLEASWEKNWFAPDRRHLPKLLATVPVNATTGNHDVEDGGALYETLYPYPYVADRYWSFDYGPVHAVILNQYPAEAVENEQLRWLKDDLETSDRRWKIVVLHEPEYSAGGGDTNANVRRQLQPIFQEYGVDMVLGGHIHYYARVPVNGVQHLTIGGGGGPLVAPKPGEKVAVVKSAHHYLEIAVNGSTLRAVARDLHGGVIDEFQLTKEEVH